MSDEWKPDVKTLRWAAGQVSAAGPATPDTAELNCAAMFIGRAKRRLVEHADMLDASAAQTEISSRMSESFPVHLGAKGDPIFTECGIDRANARRWTWDASAATCPRCIPA